MLRIRHAFLLPSLVLAAHVAGATERSESDMWVLCRENALFDFYRPDLPRDGNREDAPTDLVAQAFNIQDKTRYEMTGGVEILRADQRIAADRLFYDTEAETYDAEGNVQYQDRGLLLGAERARGELANDRNVLDDVDYQLLDSRGNGSAATAVTQGNTSDLTRVVYTTCDPGHHSWELRAREVKLDQAEGVGTAKHATLRVGNVPILYLPYASFPIDDRRRSGFLFPSIGSSQDNGIDISVPYYLNLAPNYDATLIPRIIGRRGLMLGGEFRYLTDTQRGEIYGTYLPDDDLTGEDRGSLTFRHNGRLGDNWSVNANINHISDDRYFEDFGDSLATASTTLLESTAAINGRGQYWNASVAVQEWDLTDPSIDAVLRDRAEPYRRLPRALFSYEQPFADWFNVGLRSEGIAFDHSDKPGATRVDLMPYISMPFERAAGFVRPEIAYRYTTYSLDSARYENRDYIDRSPQRGVPIYSVDAGLFYERSMQWFDRPMLQTLEPRLYYLYVPYRDQNDLPVFDTQELSFAFNQLFRPNRFTGADRQTDANQLAAALTTRFLDETTGRERFSASLGQIRYFEPQRVQLPGVPTIDRPGSAYVADAALSLDDRWSVGASHQWDPEDELSDLSALRAQYRWSDAGVANFAYRFRRHTRGAFETQAQVEQIDASVLVPLNDRWRLVARWNYSLLDNSTLEAMGGIEWDNCCLAMRVLGRHYLKNSLGEKNNGIYIEMEFKGLATLGRKSGELLERAILGYSR